MYMYRWRHHTHCTRWFHRIFCYNDIKIKVNKSHNSRSNATYQEVEMKSESSLSLRDILPVKAKYYDKNRAPKLSGQPTIVYFHVTVLSLDSINEESMVGSSSINLVWLERVSRFLCSLQLLWLYILCWSNERKFLGNYYEFDRILNKLLKKVCFIQYENMKKILLKKLILKINFGFRDTSFDRIFLRNKPTGYVYSDGSFTLAGSIAALCYHDKKMGVPDFRGKKTLWSVDNKQRLVKIRLPSLHIQ